MTKNFGVPLLSDDALQHITNGILSQTLGQPAHIQILTREYDTHSTKFPTEILYIETKDYQRYSIFLKHLDDECSNPSDRYAPDHEILVYDKFFRDNSLPVPRYYGSRWNPNISRYHLFLEQVKGQMLKHSGVDYWYMAARSLAKFHAYFACKVESLSQCKFLPMFDADYYTSWANKALVSTAQKSRELADRLGVTMLDFDNVAELIAKQPVTLVHNDLSSKNVIVDTTESPARIVFVDWEETSLGFAIIDLVHLKYNRLRPEEDEHFCSEYFDELSCQGVTQIAGENPAVLLNASELFFTFYRIAHSSLWGESPAQLNKRVETACRIHERFKKSCRPVT